MLNSVRLIFAVLIILLIVPQTPTENFLLRKLHEMGIFANYNEAKWFLNFFTWFSIFFFLILTFFYTLQN
uniref:Hypothetical chloroplast RF47 n=1 Tax=Interfilum terricola TaxID=163310 RepID=A0A097KPQ9_9VIRI|nr:hypothetical chloroplast RF47 [Interfilum terricola]AIT95145.1 hypothetical chloroplast RF47 [Interfilum terricola]